MPNHISEWFGHRVYPKVAGSSESIANQSNHRCPFLSAVLATDTECVKSASSQGVCTINSPSNGRPQDWVVCPYRVISSSIIQDAAERMYGQLKSKRPVLLPAPRVSEPRTQKMLKAAIANGERVLVYFTDKLGGEISIAGTKKSPELAFDTTVVELVDERGAIRSGRFAIVEIQTMDFHGSYARAVRNLSDALRLHRKSFPAAVQSNLTWTRENIEGPNIANVFKRTFYQLMFKFQIGTHDECAGCTLAIPESVWDSWQPHLGGPELIKNSDGTVSLPSVGSSSDPGSIKQPAWIHVFDIDSTSRKTPNPVVTRKIIRVNAQALAHYALEVASDFALETIDSPSGLRASINRRLARLWPDLRPKKDES